MNVMIVDESIYKIFKMVGKHLVRHGYNTSHSGNKPKARDRVRYC